MSLFGVNNSFSQGFDRKKSTLSNLKKISSRFLSSSGNFLPSDFATTIDTNILDVFQDYVTEYSTPRKSYDMGTKLSQMNYYVPKVHYEMKKPAVNIIGGFVGAKSQQNRESHSTCIIRDIVMQLLPDLLSENEQICDQMTENFLHMQAQAEEYYGRKVFCAEEATTDLMGETDSLIIEKNTQNYTEVTSSIATTMQDSCVDILPTYAAVVSAPPPSLQPAQQAAVSQEKCPCDINEKSCARKSKTIKNRRKKKRRRQKKNDQLEKNQQQESVSCFEISECDFPSLDEQNTCLEMLSTETESNVKVPVNGDCSFDGVRFRYNDDLCFVDEVDSPRCREVIYYVDKVDLPRCRDNINSVDEVDSPLCRGAIFSVDEVDSPRCRDSTNSLDKVDSPRCRENINSLDKVDSPRCREDIYSIDEVDSPRFSGFSDGCAASDSASACLNNAISFIINGNDELSDSDSDWSCDMVDTFDDDVWESFKQNFECFQNMFVVDGLYPGEPPQREDDCILQDDEFLLYVNHLDANGDSVCIDVEEGIVAKLLDANQRWDSAMQDVPIVEKQNLKISFAPDSQLVRVHHFEGSLEEIIPSWELERLDRCHFKNRIQTLEPILSPCFDVAHRQKVWAKLHAEV